MKKLSEKDTQEIISRREKGDRVKDIAELFGVTESTIYAVTNRARQSKHVTRKAQIIEIPMATTPKKVAVIICDPSSVAEVVGSLWK